MYEFYALVGVVIVFAILFAVGLRSNANAMIRYAEQIRSASSPFCKFVGFKRYSRGFKALCLPKEDMLFNRIDITVSLTWRENPMYYILYPFLRDRDRIFVWGTLTKKHNMNIQICKRNCFKKFNKSFEKIELNKFGMIAVIDNLEKGKEVLDKIEEDLFASKNCIDFFSIKDDEIWIKIVGRIVDDYSIKNIFNLLMKSGYVMEDFV
ncbi:MAG: hypothetical protein ACPLZF_02315 [Nitrososphaeria archaeon]